MLLKSCPGEESWYSWRVWDGAVGDGIPGVGLRHDCCFRAKDNLPKLIVLRWGLGKSFGIFAWGVNMLCDCLLNGFTWWFWCSGWSNYMLIFGFWSIDCFSFNRASLVYYRVEEIPPSSPCDSPIVAKVILAGGLYGCIDSCAEFYENMIESASELFRLLTDEF